jgi:hypothetical protein
VSDTPKPSAADAYETAESLLCEMQGLRDELVDVKRERDEAREALRLIADDCDAWLANLCDETCCEMVKLVGTYARGESK